MQVILINGPSSAGKSSIVKELQDALPTPYLALRLDKIIATMPAYLNDYHEDLKPREGFGWIASIDEQGRKLRYLTPGEYGKAVYNMLRKQVKCLLTKDLM